MFLGLIAFASVLLGYWISSLVPTELPIGERWFLVATAVFCIPLFFLFAWWKAALIAGLVLLGWLPALLGFAWGAMTEATVVMQLLCVLGVLVGSRWRTEKRSFTYLLVAIVVLAALSLLPQFI